MKSLVVVSATVLLAACASTSSAPIDLGNGRHMISSVDKSVFGSYGAKVAEVVEKANSFCNSQRAGSRAVVLETTGRDAAAGVPASAAITFRCE